jgi:PII interaction protein X
LFFLVSSPYPAIIMLSSAANSHAAQTRTSTETYLNHPTFGLLFRVCVVEDNRELFTPLYAQRLFFIVTNHPEGVQFDPIGRTDARIMVETRLRTLRRNRQQQEHDQLMITHKQIFQ